MPVLVVGNALYELSSDATGSDVAAAAARVHLGLGSAALTTVIDSIADADTTNAPSRNAVFDALALKAPLVSPALTGSPTAPTQSAGDNSTKLATTAYVDSGLAPKAPLASPALTGSPTAPTQAAGDNSTKIATTAYVDNPIIFRAHATTNQSIASSSGTGVGINLDQEDVDTANGHSTTSNTDTYTCQAGGWYRVTGTVHFAGSSAGTIRKLQIIVNGTTVTEASQAPSAAGQQLQASDLVHLTFGSSVRLGALQDTGSNLNLIGGSFGQTSSLVVEFVHA